MKTAKAATSLVILLLVTGGCSQPETNPRQGPTPPTEGPATFANRVWRVAESSSVAPGHLYVFLSEGTLVVASQDGKPALGTWSGEGNALTMVEEGIPYRVDVLGLSRTEFRIRIHNPGGAVEIRFVLAEQAPPVPDRR